MTNRDDETGKFTPDNTNSELVSFLEEAGPVGTQVIASEFNYSRSAMYRRLRVLERNNKITSEMIGGSKLWDVA